MIDIAKALYALGIHDIIVHGSPSSETEFFTQCKKIVGTTETNEAILSTDPKDFGITWAEVKAKFDEMTSEYDAQEYARARQPLYPAIGDQLDMQYHDQLNGTTTWKDAIAKVKADNPKEAE
jgi:hypothetical protein